MNSKIPGNKFLTLTTCNVGHFNNEHLSIYKAYSSNVQLQYTILNFKGQRSTTYKYWYIYSLMNTYFSVLIKNNSILIATDMMYMCSSELCNDDLNLFDTDAGPSQLYKL